MATPAPSACCSEWCRGQRFPALANGAPPDTPRAARRLTRVATIKAHVPLAHITNGDYTTPQRDGDANARPEPGYPIKKLGSKWTWSFRSISAPVLFKTKRAATDSFVAYMGVLRDCAGNEAYLRAVAERDARLTA